MINQSPDDSNNRSNQVGFRLLGLSNIVLRDNYSNGNQSNGSIYNESSGQDFSISGITLLSDMAPLTIQPTSRRFSRSYNSNYLPRNSTLYSEGNTYSSDSHYGLSWTPFPFLHYDWDFVKAENNSTTTENRTTDIAYTTQTYPRSHIKHNLSWGVADWIKSTFMSDYDLQENVNETTYFATSDVTPLTINRLTNTSHLDSFALNNQILQKIQPTNINVGRVYDDYIDSTKGLKYRDAQTLASDTSFTVWGAQVTPKFSYAQTLQYLRTSIDNISLEQIKSNFNSYLNNRTYTFNLDGTQPLNNYFSLLANYGYQRILETTQALPATENSTAFTVHSLGIGLKSTPIPDLLLSYTYTYKMNINEIINIGFQNYADTFVAQYTPIVISTPKYTSKIIATYRRDHSWGVGLNDFAKLENNQVNNNTLATDIQTLDNISTVGNIQANVEIPMAERSNGNIEKFIFTAEGNIVEKKDLTTGGGLYNYTITSLVFSGKLVF